MRRSLIAVMLLLAAPLASAQVYKWTDASGTVHYSEAPPAQGTKYSKVTTTGTVEPLAPMAPPSTTPNNSETQSSPGATQKPMTDTPANRSQLCDSLKANITVLQGKAPVIMNQNGKSSALDADQRKQQTDAAQAQYQQYCQGS